MVLLTALCRMHVLAFARSADRARTMTRALPTWRLMGVSNYLRLDLEPYL